MPVDAPTREKFTEQRGELRQVGGGRPAEVPKESRHEQCEPRPRADVADDAVPVGKAEVAKRDGRNDVDVEAVRLHPHAAAVASEQRPGLVERARLGVRRRPTLGVVDHQMAVHRDVSSFEQSLDDGQPYGQVGHEVVVHHVAVHPVARRVGDRVGKTVAVVAPGREAREVPAVTTRRLVERAAEVENL